MDEDAYRATYQRINHTRCVFEKLILLRYGSCQNANKLLLAEREAYACESADDQAQCQKLLDLLRNNARFSLQLTHVEGPLPHAKELKVQAGGLFGLQQLLSEQNVTQIEALHDDNAKFGEQPQTPIHNVIATLDQAITSYNGLNSIPYNELVKSIINFKLRERKRRKKK
jgi:hypothetical protein